MEYDQVKALAERWLAGGTTLAEEAALREWFAAAREEGLPVDLQPFGLLFGQSAQAAGERSHRKLVLHTEPAGRPAPTLRRRWIAAASAVAAAVAVAARVLTIHPGAPQSDILCVVNGVRITDPEQIESYTRHALGVVNDNLGKPGRAISSELAGNPALERAARVLQRLDITAKN
jgi:hypothetical protein